MTLQQLEYVVALDNHRHFVKAANSCFVTQPTLTMQVKKLEEEIGIKLFDRDSTPLKPTAAGENIIIKARQVLMEVAQMKAFVSNETESVEGTFTLGIIPTIAPYLLPLFLPGFIAANPKTHLIIKELPTHQIINQLKNGLLDMGLLSTPLEEKMIREIALYYEPFLLYLPHKHNWTQTSDIDPKQLNQKEMLLLEEGHCFREQALAICHNRQQNKGRNFEYESGSIEALKGLVKQGMGYTLVPELAVTDELGADNIKRFVSPQPAREISLVVHNGFTKEALINRLHQSIIAVIPKQFVKAKTYTKVKWH